MLADSGVAVILLTASELDERIFATLRAGARGPVLKDTEPAELVRAIELLARGDALLSPTLTRRLIAELAAIPDPQLPSSDLLDELTPANARSSRSSRSASATPPSPSGSSSAPAHPRPTSAGRCSSSAPTTAANSSRSTSTPGSPSPAPKGRRATPGRWGARHNDQRLDRASAAPPVDRSGRVHHPAGDDQRAVALQAARALPPPA